VIAEGAIAEVPLAEWADRARALRDDGYAVFDSLVAWPTSDGLGVRLHLRRRDGRLHGIRTEVPDGEPLGSLTTLFRGAAWPEREAAELLGLCVAGFDDGTGLGLRPLLVHAPTGMPGEPGYPLRHEFPLTARTETPWPGREARK
jgi:NADH-quinone oxidoreductase subunit C